MLFQENWNLALVTVAAAVLLGLATLGYWFLYWFKPSTGLPKIGPRIRFIWILLGFFLAAVSFGRGYLLFYLAYISFLALKEFLSLTPTRRADRRVLFFAYLAIPIQFYLIWNGWFPAFISFVPIYVFFFLALMMAVVGETLGFLKAYSSLNWGMMMTVYSLGHLAYLFILPPQGGAIGGAGLFLFLLLLTQLNDVAQFLFGKLFGYPPLRLKVSTTRTWASQIGSIVSTALLAWLLAPLLTPLRPAEAIAAGIVIAIGGFIGYITLTAVKRDLQLKDRGTMTPGQGGILNRIDSIIFTAPLFFHIVYYLYY